jgi:hypothetical protein
VFNETFVGLCDRLVGKPPSTVADLVRRERGEQEVSMAARQPVTGIEGDTIGMRQTRPKFGALDINPSFFLRPEGR